LREPPWWQRGAGVARPRGLAVLDLGSDPSRAARSASAREQQREARAAGKTHFTPSDGAGSLLFAQGERTRGARGGRGLSRRKPSASARASPTRPSLHSVTTRAAARSSPIAPA